MPLPHGLHTHAVILTPCLTSPLSCVPSTSPLTFVLLFLFMPGLPGKAKAEAEVGPNVGLIV